MNAFQGRNKKTNDPYGNGIGCRACEDFKTWSKKQSDVYHTSNETPRREDCPLDSSGLGKVTWGLLHTISVSYPENPTDDQKKDVKEFINILSRVYPCEYCAKDFREDIITNPINASSRNEFSLWLCNFHNRVNGKLGKPAFDCTKTYERWRDGWLDGSCD